MTPTNSIFEFCLRRVSTPYSQLDYITRRDIPSRFYTSSFFGLMVKFGPSVSAVWSKIFGRLVKTFRPSGQNFSENQFFIYSAVWIRPYGLDSIFVLNLCFKLFPKKCYFVNLITLCFCLFLLL